VLIINTKGVFMFFTSQIITLPIYLLLATIYKEV